MAPWSPVSVRNWLVYQHELREVSTSHECGSFASQWATPAMIREVFRDDNRRKARFLEFLRTGRRGLILMADQGWAGYAWLSPPGAAGPPHLPISIARERHWVFHCRTHESFRRRGLYKLALRQVISHVSASSCEASLFIDTQVENLAARRAFASVGFTPRGVARTTTVGLPRIASWTHASWRPGQAHPAPDSSAAQLPNAA